MEGPRVVGATAVIGGPVTFVVLPENSDEHERWLSSSQFVVEAMLPAVLSNSRVSVELLGGSKVIRRVLPYSLAAHVNWPRPSHEYRISSIATQKMADGEDEHLEVFLQTLDEPEVAYNVYDAFLKAMLLAAFWFSSEYRGPEVYVITVVIDGGEIVSATIGES